ncbi:MAG: cytochrome oxidase small assembly protein [Piscinibacter sp.]|nr:cytochrome oxidase small assembly protein [Piscinibacter sp.]
MATSPEQRRANLRLALILASVAAALFVGFVVKIATMGA